MRALTCLLLASCAAPASLPVDRAPPAGSLTLTMGPLVPGQPVEISVTGALPQERVYLMRTTVGGGPGSCPPELGGLCMDMEAPYDLTLDARSGPAGGVSWTIPSFPSLPPTDVWFQAVTIGAAPSTSNVAYRPVLASCVQDASEPNDTLARAAVVSPGTTTGLVGCPADDDFFAVPVVAPGEYVAAAAFFDHGGEGDLDLLLLSANGTVLDESLSLRSIEQVAWRNDGSQPVAVGVRASVYADAYGVVGVPYDLALEVGTPAACPADATEPDDTQAAAVPLTGAASGHACADEDWFSVDVAADEVLSIRLTPAPEDGAVSVALYDAAGNVLDADDDGDVLELFALGDGGPLSLRVWQTADDPRGGGVPYTVQAQRLATAACTVDVTEPDDDAASATPISGTVSAHACDADVDWYRLDVQPGDAVTGTLRHDTSVLLQDVDLRLLDGAGVELDDLDLDLTSPESVYAVAETADTWFLEVRADAVNPLVGAVPYTLETTVETVALCAADAYEPNDDDASAASVVPSVYPGLTACDEVGAGPGGDWFVYDMGLGEQITVDLRFVDAEGDLDLQLYDVAGALSATSASVTDDEQIVFTATSAGPVYLRAYLWADDGAGQQGNTYELELQTNTPI